MRTAPNLPDNESNDLQERLRAGNHRRDIQCRRELSATRPAPHRTTNRPISPTSSSLTDSSKTDPYGLPPAVPIATRSGATPCTRNFPAFTPSSRPAAAVPGLWPLSRASMPKFLHPLSPDGNTLLSATVSRVSALADLSRTFVITGAAHAVAVARQCPDLPTDNILVEPTPRDSCGDRSCRSHHCPS
jgi:hypothetical protein